MFVIAADAKATHQDVIRVMDVAGQLGFRQHQYQYQSPNSRLLVKKDLQVYLRLLSYLKPFGAWQFLVIIGFAINAATEVSVAKLLEKIIEAIQHRDQGFTTLFPIFSCCCDVLPWAGFVHGRLFYCGYFK